MDERTNDWGLSEPRNLPAAGGVRDYSGPTTLRRVSASHRRPSCLRQRVPLSERMNMSTRGRPSGTSDAAILRVAVSIAQEGQPNFIRPRPRATARRR